VIMHMLDHPNIAKLIDTFQDFKNIYLVTEACEGMEIIEAITREPKKGDFCHGKDFYNWSPSLMRVNCFTEGDCAFVIEQLFSAVHYMHERQIMHREIKPENMLLFHDGSIQNNVLKLIGFGDTAKCEEEEFLKTKIGASLYVSPQVIMGWYNREADVWSCGVVMYLLLSGLVPFDGKDDAEILGMVIKGEFELDIPEFRTVSRSAKQLIVWCLTKDPYRRCTAEQAHIHAWCKGENPPAEVQPADNGAALVERLRNFRQEQRSKKVGFEMMVKELEEHHVRNLHEAFGSLDTDCTGLLSIKEVNSVLAEAGFEEALPELQAFMQEIAAREKGLVNYSEFLAQIVDKKLYIQEDLCWEAFREHDTQHSGFIPASEVVAILANPHEVCSSEQVAAAIRRKLEKSKMSNKGGLVVSFMDFLAMLRTATLEEVGMSPASPSRSPRRKKSPSKKSDAESPTTSRDRRRQKRAVSKGDSERGDSRSASPDKDRGQQLEPDAEADNAEDRHHQPRRQSTFKGLSVGGAIMPDGLADDLKKFISKENMEKPGENGQQNNPEDDSQQGHRRHRHRHKEDQEQPDEGDQKRRHRRHRHKEQPDEDDQQSRSHRRSSRNPEGDDQEKKERKEKKEKKDRRRKEDKGQPDEDGQISQNRRHAKQGEEMEDASTADGRSHRKHRKHRRGGENQEDQEEEEGEKRPSPRVSLRANLKA